MAICTAWVKRHRVGLGRYSLNSCDWPCLSYPLAQNSETCSSSEVTDFGTPVMVGKLAGVAGTLSRYHQT